MTTITITLPEKEKERLNKLAVQYGLSLRELGRKVFEQLSSEFPQESWSDYAGPKTLKDSFKRALNDYKKGHFSSAL